MENGFLNLSLKKFLGTITDCTFDLGERDIFRYLKHITDDFDVKAIECTIDDIEKYVEIHTDFENANKESQKKYEKHGWEIPMSTSVIMGKTITTPDYEKMRAKTHWEYKVIEKVINILKEKLNKNAPATDTEKEIIYSSEKPQQSKKIKETGNFSDCLHHENKSALMVKLHELIDGKSAKDVAITIQSLINLSYLVNYGRKANLYAMMRKEFEFINDSHSALNGWLNTNRKKITDSDTKPIEIILSAIK